MRHPGGLLLPFLLALLVAAGAGAQDEAAAAREAAADLATATAGLEDATRARDRVAALTATIRAHEDGLAALREGLRRAALREAAIRATFESRREQLARLIGVMTAMERSQGPLLLLHPSGPLGTARSGMILSDLAPALQRQAEKIRRELEEIEALRSLRESAARTLEEGLRAAQTARTELSQAIADRSETAENPTTDAEILRALVLSADTLEAVAEGMLGMAAPGDGSGAGDFEAARGALPMPVLGTVLRRFNEADAAGVSRPGLIIATSPRALVTAPWPATIRYRGPLLDYGNVMLLEPAAGYLLVLAGLDVVYGDAGEVVPAGAALGLMGGAAPADGEFAALADFPGGVAERSETLYIEIRRDSEPHNPADWFAQTRE